MALSITCIANVQTGGDDTNGGLFNAAGSSPGTDSSTSTTPVLTIDGATITAAVTATTSIIQVTGGTVTAAMNRNGFQINGGTATAGVYEIISVDTVNNRFTVDRAAGTSTQTVIGKVGGCWATPGKATVMSNASHKTYIKSGTYTVGAQAVGSGLTEGYGATPGDLAGTPLIQANANSITVIAGGSNSSRISNLKVDANGHTTVQGFGTVRGPVVNCIAKDCNIGFNTSSVVYKCLATNCTTGFGTGTNICYECVASTGTTGFNTATGCYIRCFALSTSGVGFSAASASGGLLVSNCVAYACGTGFSVINDEILNCIASNSTGKGFSITSGNVSHFTTNADFAPGTASDGSPTVLGNSPFVNPGATVNTITDAVAAYALNNTAGGGQTCRNAGTELYLDIGALQHQPPLICSGS